MQSNFAWAMLKGQIARKNSSFKMSSLKDEVVKAMDDVRPENWKNMVGHVVRQALRYQKLDADSNVDVALDFCIEEPLPEPESEPEPEPEPSSEFEILPASELEPAPAPVPTLAPQRETVPSLAPQREPLPGPQREPLPGPQREHFAWTSA